jgi:hypothetical protein
MDRCAEAHGVTITRGAIRANLWEEDGLPIGELTQRVGRQGPTTVVAVQLLEKAGLMTVGRKLRRSANGSFPLLRNSGIRPLRISAAYTKEGSLVTFLVAH